MLQRKRASGELSILGDRSDRRNEADHEIAGALSRRNTPAVFVLDEFLNVLFFREDPNERRSECRMPEGEIALPPLVERTVIGLLRRSIGQDPGTAVLIAAPNASISVRLVILNGRREAAYAVIVERMRLRRHVQVIAQRFGLSARERQVLEMVARGAKNSEIAARLNIAESTAIFHVKRLLSKTNARNRTELASIVGAG